jgi:23S rRNA (pseudouridine1915-N3)-methyltransferase
MLIKLLCVGKIKERYLREAVDEYLARLRHYTPVEYVEIEAEPRGKKSRDLDVKQREAARIRKVLTTREFVVALDEHGVQQSSQAFANFISQCQVRGDMKTLTFVTGGATGFLETFLSEANFVLALSKMTFPHQVCRLILVEQLYRAYTIIAGESYHKS